MLGEGKLLNFTLAELTILVNELRPANGPAIPLHQGLERQKQLNRIAIAGEVEMEDG